MPKPHLVSEESSREPSVDAETGPGMSRPMCHRTELSPESRASTLRGGRATCVCRPPRVGLPRSLGRLCLRRGRDPGTHGRTAVTAYVKVQPRRNPRGTLQGPFLHRSHASHGDLPEQHTDPIRFHGDSGLARFGAHCSQCSLRAQCTDNGHERLSVSIHENHYWRARPPATTLRPRLARALPGGTTAACNGPFHPDSRPS